MSSLSGLPKGGRGASQEPVPQENSDAGVLQVPVPLHHPHQRLQLSFQEIQMPKPQATTGEGLHSTALHFKQSCKLLFSYLNCTDWAHVR